MIFTIGHKKSYLQAIAENGSIKKLGKCILTSGEPYTGGYAFLTQADAQRRIDEAYPERGFAVFGLDADWDKDTIRTDGKWWHSLLRDAEIVVLE